MTNIRCKNCGAFLGEYHAADNSQHDSKPKETPENNKPPTGKWPQWLSSSAISAGAATLSVILVLITTLTSAHLIFSSFNFSIAINPNLESTNDKFPSYIFNSGRKPARIFDLQLKAKIPCPVAHKDIVCSNNMLEFNEFLVARTPFKMLAQAGYEIEVKTKEPKIEVHLRFKKRNKHLQNVNNSTLQAYLIDRKTTYQDCHFEAVIDTSKSLWQYMFSSGFQSTQCSTRDENGFAICRLNSQKSQCEQLVRRIFRETNPAIIK
jgi:hypothetical protein